MDISQLNFDYLTLRQGPDTVQHTSDYIKSGNGAKATRRIFYGVPLENFEKKEIQRLEAELSATGSTLLPGWNERETLKYLYATKFDYEKSIKRIQSCIEWRNNPASRTLTKDVLRLFESGALYMYGRDKQFRPIIVFDFGKVDFNTIKGEDFNVAITILLDIAIRHCYVPGKVENNIIIIDTRQLSLTSLPISTMKNWVAIGNACFPSNLFKTYVVGPPFLIRMSWKMIEGLLEKETAEKIEILAVDELKKMQTFIDPNQLELKFGGNLPDLTTYWPPQSTFENSLTPTSSRSQREYVDPLDEGKRYQPNSSNPLSRGNTYNDPLNENLKLQSSFPQNRAGSTIDPYFNDQRQPLSNQRYTSASRIEPSGLIEPRIDLQMNQRYTSAPRLEPSSLLNDTSQRRTQIFDSRPGRLNQDPNHSPMRVKDKDEDLVKEILNRNASPKPGSPTSFDRRPEERVKKAAPVFKSMRNEVLDTLGDNRAQEKKMDEKLDRELRLEANNYYQFPLETRYVSNHPEESTEPDIAIGWGARQGLVDMIKKEDKFLRNTHQFYTQIDPVQLPVPERNTNLSYTPNTINYTALIPEESAKRTAQVSEESAFARPLSYSTGADIYESTYENNRSVRDWPIKPHRELPRAYEQDDSDDTDEETNYCGICVSKKGRKRKASH